MAISQDVLPYASDCDERLTRLELLRCSHESDKVRRVELGGHDAGPTTGTCKGTAGRTNVDMQPAVTWTHKPNICNRRNSSRRPWDATHARL